MTPTTQCLSGLIRSQEHQRPLVEAVRQITGKPYKVGIFKKSMEVRRKNEPDDPMDELAKNASRAGIEVEEH